MSETVVYRAACPGCGAEGRWYSTNVLSLDATGRHQRKPEYRIECPTKGCTDARG